MCYHCGVRGHAASIHEETSKDVQDELKAIFGSGFEFVAPDLASHSNQLKRILPHSSRGGRGGVGGEKCKPTNNNQHAKIPKLTMLKKM